MGYQVHLGSRRVRIIALKAEKANFDSTSKHPPSIMVDLAYSDHFVVVESDQHWLQCCIQCHCFSSRSRFLGFVRDSDIITRLAKSNKQAIEDGSMESGQIWSCDQYYFGLLVVHHLDIHLLSDYNTCDSSNYELEYRSVRRNHDTWIVLVWDQTEASFRWSKSSSWYNGSTWPIGELKIRYGSVISGPGGCYCYLLRKKC